MGNDIAYPNNNLGKSGWFYWAIPLLMACPLVLIFLFLLSVFQSDYSNIEKVIFLVGVLFFAFYLSKGYEVLKIGSKTAKKIIVLDDKIEFTTYLGSKYKFNSDFETTDCSHRFLKKHLQLLFPLGCNVFCVTLDGKEYYLPVEKAL